MEPNENERMLALAKDNKRKGVIGYDTANVLQDLADSQISKLKDTNRELNQSNMNASNEIKRCHD